MPASGSPWRHTLLNCTAEFGTCGRQGAAGCCAPHRCYKQSEFYSQCGSSCPNEPAWACHDALPSIALVVARWGGWPAWTPLFLRTLGANPTVDFMLLSDATPAPLPLPANVRLYRVTLAQLLARLRRTVGVRLGTLTPGAAEGKFGSGVSSAKTNDFKPMFGEAFADLLAPYDWWGHLQEDLLLGDLRAFATRALLSSRDVLCPYVAPLNASGVLMLYRNAPHVNRVWRSSADAARVLSDP